MCGAAAGGGGSAATPAASPLPRRFGGGVWRGGLAGARPATTLPSTPPSLPAAATAPCPSRQGGGGGASQAATTAPHPGVRPEWIPWAGWCGAMRFSYLGAAPAARVPRASDARRRSDRRRPAPLPPRARARGRHHRCACRLRLAKNILPRVVGEMEKNIWWRSRGRGAHVRGVSRALVGPRPRTGARTNRGGGRRCRDIRGGSKEGVSRIPPAAPVVRPRHRRGPRYSTDPQPCEDPVAHRTGERGAGRQRASERFPCTGVTTARATLSALRTQIFRGGSVSFGCTDRAAHHTSARSHLSPRGTGRPTSVPLFLCASGRWPQTPAPATRLASPTVRVRASCYDGRQP